mgnify:CR=1 FL=1
MSEIINGKEALIALANGEEVQVWNGNIWWDKSNGGAGNGFKPNYVIPINPSPLVGMQSWNDTICKIKKI